jgi:hypothetical protein
MNGSVCTSSCFWNSLGVYAVDGGVNFSTEVL